jgi:hypothetical protein
MDMVNKGSKNSFTTRYYVSRHCSKPRIFTSCDFAKLILQKYQRISFDFLRDRSKIFPQI